MIFETLSLGIDAKEFQSGLNEICNHLEGNRPDEYLNGMVQEVRKASQSLYGAFRLNQVRQNLLEETRLVNKRVTAAVRNIESHCYVSDPEVQASAKVLKQLFESQGKPFSKMSTGTRIVSLNVVLDKLDKEEMQVHVKRLPDLADMISDIRKELAALEAKQMEVDLANSKAEAPKQLLPLKREARSELNKLLGYLSAMAIKEPKVYAEDYGMVAEIISRMQAAYKAKLKGKAAVAAEAKPGDEPRLSISA